MTRSPYQHFDDVRVTRVRRVTPHMARITLGGLETLPEAGLDHRVKLFFPLPGEERPIYPTGDDWWTRWCADPSAVRAVFRTYTIRRFYPETGEADVDFVLHGDAGPGSRWALQAQAGDRIGVWGPHADYDPPVGTDWVLLAGDETALPAIGAILEALPAGTDARAFIEVADAAERQSFETKADVDITWVHRDGAGHGCPLLLDTVRAAGLPGGAAYAWIAGEAGNVKSLRRHLVNERGMDRKAIYFSGYWRRGVNHEDL